MKKSGLWLGLLLASAASVSAQVTVSVELDQDEFMPGEALPVAVCITNRSGQTLHLGKNNDWLTFSIESRDRYVVLKTGEVPVAGEFNLDSSMRAIKRVNLAPWFNLSRPGRYSFPATVTLSDWNRQITSAPRPFDIIDGAKLWEQEVGVPDPAATNSPPEVRKFTLLQANYLRHHLMLYFQLTDSSGQVRKVFPVGPMLSFGQPVAQVDKLSNLHVLYQNGPHSFHYVVLNPNGQIIGRRTYGYTTRPRMQADQEGNIQVAGGQLRVSADDLPPPGPAPAPAPDKTATP